MGELIYHPEAAGVCDRNVGKVQGCAPGYEITLRWGSERVILAAIAPRRQFRACVEDGPGHSVIVLEARSDLSTLAI